MGTKSSNRKGTFISKLVKVADGTPTEPFVLQGQRNLHRASRPAHEGSGAGHLHPHLCHGPASKHHSPAGVLRVSEEMDRIHHLHDQFGSDGPPPPPALTLQDACCKSHVVWHILASLLLPGKPLLCRYLRQHLHDRVHRRG